jgi:hypothetical protein
MTTFLAEWSALERTLSSDEDREAWKKVSEYAQRVSREVHTYLKFEGE